MAKNHLGLLCNIGELNALFAGSDNIEAFLQQIVAMVSDHMDADVCSIYLYDEDFQELVLKATIGLNPDLINHTKLKIGEGLVGLAVQQKSALCEKNASMNPHFKLIPGMNEESYQSFLAMPISRGVEIIGALVIQRKESNSFSENDVMALKAITSQLASAIENTRILMSLRVTKIDTESVDRLDSYKIFKAEVASEGIVTAKATVIDDRKPYQALKKYVCKNSYTIEHFNRAVALTEKQLEDLQAQIERKLTGVSSLIFEAHILMLKDSEFTGSMLKFIKDGQDPVSAILKIADDYVEKFSTSLNEYTREKTNDVMDLARRLIHNLLSENHENDLGADWRGHIVIAKELYPSDILKLASEEVSGIILVGGGVTSHLSILARSLQIPMVIAGDSQLLKIFNNTMVLLNAELGSIHINPTEEMIANYRKEKKAELRLSKLMRFVKPTTFTQDGVRIQLLSNINLLMDTKRAQDFQSEGIGLYRTEFPFMIRSNFPTEEEQIIIYSTIMEQMEGKPVTIRTLDIGGDKVLAYYDNMDEKNPSLGMRSIRFSLHHKEIFHQQIRAILRAGSSTEDLRMTFPMVSSVDDFIQAKGHVMDCMEQLKKENFTYHENPKIGIMVETPSTLEIIDELARESDFFCIGTNDFIQFMLAVDRTNSMVSPYYVPHHPAILRSLKKIVDAAEQQNKPVSVCGEMAHQKCYIPFLLGIGLRTLSIAPRYVPQVQHAVSNLSMEDSIALANESLDKNTISDLAILFGIN